MSLRKLLVLVLAILLGCQPAAEQQKIDVEQFVVLQQTATQQPQLKCSFTLWDEDGHYPQDSLKSWWYPTLWTIGITQTDDPPESFQRLGLLCKNGGRIKDYLIPKNYAFADYYHRWDIFKDGIVPPDTLLVADVEGTYHVRDDYAISLCQNILKVNKNFVIYPGFIYDQGINFSWTPQLREIDFFTFERAWADTLQPGLTKMLRTAAGKYVMIEFYLVPNTPDDPDAQTREYRTWSIMLNFLRQKMPDKEVIGLIQGGYAYPSPGILTDDERHRYARFIKLSVRRVWLWGGLKGGKKVAEDLDSLRNPMFKWPGEEGWKEVPD